MRKKILIFAVLCLCSTHLGCTAIFSALTQSYSDSDNDVYIRLNSFSPDNKIISIDYIDKSRALAGLLDIRTGRVEEIVSSDPDEFYTSGTFSPSGRYMVFSVKKKSEKFRYGQLIVYDMENKAFKRHTYSNSMKSYPSFSKDEEKIIFAQSNRERSSGRTRFSDWDIYQLHRNTGKVERLTYYEFYSVGRPFYLSDRDGFVFSGEAPFVFEDKKGSEAYYAYKNTYGENCVFLFDTQNRELKPLLVNDQYSTGPRISLDGNRLVYQARSNKLNNAMGIKTTGFTYDLFLYENQSHRRLTNLGRSLRHYVLSFDGTLLAYSVKGEKTNVMEVQILNIDTKEQYKVEFTL